jgi:hypothetical protein
LLFSTCFGNGERWVEVEPLLRLGDGTELWAGDELSLEYPDYWSGGYPDLDTDPMVLKVRDVAGFIGADGQLSPAADFAEWVVLVGMEKINHPDLRQRFSGRQAAVRVAAIPGARTFPRRMSR